MVPVATRLVLLLAVLIQYTPVQVCAIEQAALGSSCHEWSEAHGFSGAHADEQHCGSPSESTHACVCEEPKVDGQNPSALKSTLDWAHAPVALVLTPAHMLRHANPVADPDPPPNAPFPPHLPLLI